MAVSTFSSSFLLIYPPEQVGRKHVFLLFGKNILKYYVIGGRQNMLNFFIAHWQKHTPVNKVLIGTSLVLCSLGLIFVITLAVV